MEGKQRLVLSLPSGFHFAPTDVELIVDYLRRKMDGHPPHLPIFKDVPITDYRPEQITEVFMDCGEDRWYFFTKRTRKYATGNRPDRTTPGKGYWKATGPQRLIRVGGEQLVGRRRTLVFYTRPDEEAKTAWTMYEYENLTSEEEANDKNVDKLGEWVLCTIQRQKSQRGGTGDGTVKAKPGGRKRKGKARKGTDDQVVQDQGAKEVVPELAWPEEGDERNVFELEQVSRPNKRPHIVQQQHDEPPPPCPETMMPAQDCDYGPGIAPPSQEPPPPCLETMMPTQDCDYGPGIAPPSQEPPPPCLEMMMPAQDCDYGPGIAPSSQEPPPPCPETMMPAQDCYYGPGIGPPSQEPPPQLSDSEMAASHPVVSSFDYDESMLLLLQFEMAPPVLEAGYDNCGMMTYQPATNHLDIAAVPLGAFSYGGSGAGHLDNGGYAGGHPGSLMGTCNSTYSYPQEHSYAVGTNKLATSSNSTYTYQQQHSYAIGTNKLAPNSNSTYTYQQQHSYAAGTNKLAPNSNSAYTYQQQHSYGTGTNRLAPNSNSTYTYQQQHSYAAGTNKLAPNSNSAYTYQQQHSYATGTNRLAPSSSTYTYQQQHVHTTGTNKADGTYTYQQQQACATGANKLVLVRGAMSTGIGQGSDVQQQVEL